MLARSSCPSPRPPTSSSPWTARWTSSSTASLGRSSSGSSSAPCSSCWGGRTTACPARSSATRTTAQPPHSRAPPPHSTATRASSSSIGGSAPTRVALATPSCCHVAAAEIDQEPGLIAWAARRRCMFTRARSWLGGRVRTMYSVPCTPAPICPAAVCAIRCSCCERQGKIPQRRMITTIKTSRHDNQFCTGQFEI